MTSHLRIVLTGGPGGGKSTLLEELARDPGWAARFVALPEAIQYARFLTVSPRERLFQRAIVHLQMALEDALDRALGSADSRAILCHRGSLDPLAYWLRAGWPEDEFFAFTGTHPADHYRRYVGVIHLVTAADGAERVYRRWPDAHRSEEAAEAIWLDRQLERVWSGHAHFIRLGNEGRGWAGKATAARASLLQMLELKEHLERRSKQ